LGQRIGYSDAPLRIGVADAKYPTAEDRCDAPGARQSVSLAPSALAGRLAWERNRPRGYFAANAQESQSSTCGL